MNLFWLDTDPVLAAQAHQDVHVGKMLLEAVQLLCTAFEEPRARAQHRWRIGSTPAERLAADLLPYAHTHRNHPCAVWVRASRGNFNATIALAQALAAEFRYRFDKPHASEAALDWVVRHRAEAQVPDGPLTPYALAMPEKHQIVDALYLVELPAHTVLDSGVAAYRAYYRNEKRGYRFTDKWVPAKWTRRNPPEWF